MKILHPAFHIPGNLADESGQLVGDLLDGQEALGFNTLLEPPFVVFDDFTP
jgi:hypothetical protein